MDATSQQLDGVAREAAAQTVMGLFQRRVAYKVPLYVVHASGHIARELIGSGFVIDGGMRHFEYCAPKVLLCAEIPAVLLLLKGEAIFSCDDLDVGDLIRNVHTIWVISVFDPCAVVFVDESIPTREHVTTPHGVVINLCLAYVVIACLWVGGVHLDGVALIVRAMVQPHAYPQAFVLVVLEVVLVQPRSVEDDGIGVGVKAVRVFVFREVRVKPGAAIDVVTKDAQLDVHEIGIVVSGDLARVVREREIAIAVNDAVVLVEVYVRIIVLGAQGLFGRFLGYRFLYGSCCFGLDLPLVISDGLCVIKLVSLGRKHLALGFLGVCHLGPGQLLWLRNGPAVQRQYRGHG